MSGTSIVLRETPAAAAPQPIVGYPPQPATFSIITTFLFLHSSAYPLIFSCCGFLSPQSFPPSASSLSSVFQRGQSVPCGGYTRRLFSRFLACMCLRPLAESLLSLFICPLHRSSSTAFFFSIYTSLFHCSSSGARSLDTPQIASRRQGNEGLSLSLQRPQQYCWSSA